MYIEEFIKKTNGKKIGYLYEILALITLLRVGEELDLGLMKVRKVKKTDKGYKFEVEVEDYDLESLKDYYKLYK